MKIYVALLGKEPVPIYYPIKMFGADKVFLIGTRENMDIMNNLKQFLSSNNCETKIVDAYNPIEVDQYCETLHQKYPDDTFLYNLVGGTKPMSFAAFRVASKYSAKTIYTTATNQVLDLSSYQTTDMNCDIQSEDLIRLQGQKLKGYENIKMIKPEEFKAASKVANFIAQNRKYYSRAANYFRKNFNNNPCPPNELTCGDLVCRKFDNSFTISKNGKVMLDIEHPNPYKLLFEGRWWELLVSKSVASWNKAQNDDRQIWRSVEFDQNSQTSKPDMKNEVDILVNVRTKLLFIECKSGDISQDNIYRFGTVRDTYGGQMAKAILVTYYPLKEGLYEKAKDSHVDIFDCKANASILNQFGQFLSEALKKKGV